MSIPIELYIFIFSFGLIVGSFLNVLIYRLPKEDDIVFTRSHCPRCGSLIRWYQNIPLFSYLVLGGRCSSCKECISARYPLVELLAGLAALFVFKGNLDIYGITIFFFQFTVICVFIVHFIIDLKHKILPDSLNIYLAAVFLAWSIYSYSWTYWLIGGAVGFLFPWGVTYLFYLIRGKIGLGGGDIKLFGALGLYLGVFGVIHNIFLSCMLGAVVGGIFLLVTKKGKDTHIPFGPFIIVVAFVQIFFPGFLESYLVFK